MSKDCQVPKKDIETKLKETIGNLENHPLQDGEVVDTDELRAQATSKIGEVIEGINTLSTEVGDDPEFSGEIKGLQELSKEANTLKDSFLSKLRRILNNPLGAIKEAQTVKREAAFEDEDSPLVIKELRSRIKKLEKIKGEENIPALISIAEDYVRANKKDAKKWSEVLNDLTGLMNRNLELLFGKENPSDEDLDKVLFIWKYYPGSFNWAGRVYDFKDRLCKLKINQQIQPTEEDVNKIKEEYENKINQYADLAVFSCIKNSHNQKWNDYYGDKFAQEINGWIDTLKVDPMKKDLLAFLPMNPEDKINLNLEALSEEDRELIFDLCLENNPKNILDNLKYFQDFVDKLSLEDRKKLFSQIRVYQVLTDYQELEHFMYFVKLTKEEFAFVINNFPRYMVKELGEDKVQNYLDKVRNSHSSFMVLATNSELFGLSDIDVYTALEKELTRSYSGAIGVINDDHLDILLQLSSYPDKYPQLDQEKIQHVLVEYLKNEIKGKFYQGNNFNARKNEQKLIIFIGKLIKNGNFSKDLIKEMINDYLNISRNYDLSTEIDKSVECYIEKSTDENDVMFSQTEIAERTFYENLLGVSFSDIPQENRVEVIENILCERGDYQTLFNSFYKLYKMGNIESEQKMTELGEKILLLANEEQLIKFAEMLRSYRYTSDQPALFNGLVDAIIRKKAVGALDVVGRFSTSQIVMIDKEKRQIFSEFVAKEGGSKDVLNILFNRILVSNDEGVQLVYFFDSSEGQRDEVIDRIINKDSFLGSDDSFLNEFYNILKSDYPDKKDEFWSVVSSCFDDNKFVNNFSSFYVDNFDPSIEKCGEVVDLIIKKINLLGRYYGYLGKFYNILQKHYPDKKDEFWSAVFACLNNSDSASEFSYFFVDNFDEIPEQIKNDKTKIELLVIILKQSGRGDKLCHLFDVCCDDKNENSFDESLAGELAEAYVLFGGDLSLLTITDLTSNEEKKKKNILENRIGQVVGIGWETDPEKAISMMEKMNSANVLDLKYFIIIKKIIEAQTQKQAEGDEESNKLLERASRLVVEFLVFYDSTIKNTFFDNNKLGRIKNLVIEKIIEYIKSNLSFGNVEEVKKEVLVKLLKIKKLYESSDSSEADKRMIFMDMYDLGRCFDLDFVKNIVESGEFEGLSEIDKKELLNKTIKERIFVDVREILMLSGNSQELRYLKNSGESEDLVEKPKQVVSLADKRNREMVSRILADNEVTGEIFLPNKLNHEAITHGTPFQYLNLILESGNYTGELLGSVSRSDSSGLLGVDVSRVLASEEELKFSQKYGALSNLGYGDIHIIYSHYKDSESGKIRKSTQSGYIGADHELVRSGIPSTEITGIIIKKEGIIDNVKRDIATKGFYIPILDIEGKLLFTPEEFDTLKVFYFNLSRKGYPREVINSVFGYYNRTDLSDKHRVVIDKAVEAIIKGQSKEDLAVLVSFLQSNDLNKESVDWYREVSFQEIMDFVRGRTKQKIKEKARRDIIGSVERFNKSIRVEKPPDELITEEEIVNNIFVRDFLQYQLPFTLFGKQFEQLTDDEKVELRKESNKYVQAIIQLSVGEIKENSAKKVETSSSRILEIANLFSEQKKQLMQRLWENVWTELDASGKWAPEVLAEYKKLIVPAIAGSGGRREIVLGSDLDYNLIVDDGQLVEEDRERILASLKDFVNSDLSLRMNEILGKNRIRADAGLAKKDRMPFTLVSTMAKFEINLASNRQEEEPTEVTDTDPLFIKDNGVVEKMKDNLLVINPSAEMLPAYIQRDLEIGTGKQSFMEQFENLFASIASGQMMEHIKDSLQRPIMFKLDYLLYEGLNSRPELKAEVKNIPADTAGKIEFLKKHKILNQREANICLELLAFAYKSRFLGELYSEEAKQDELKKVKNVVFKVEDLSYGERERLIELLKEFKFEVLYK